jgi:DHA1 family tetracycline resistance protein-like MFS transporter
MTAFVDILGMGIIIPILPFYAQQFGASALVTTLLFTVFALCSFISAPFLGAWSDRIGRRPVLLISIASTAIGWLVFASAHSLVLLFVGRIIDGLAAGNFPITQSYLADIAKDDKERTHNLGLIGAIFGIGLTIGPMIGGLLSAVGPSVPFWFVGGLAVANFLLALKFLPESHHQRSTEKLSINPFSPIVTALSDKLLLPGFITIFLFGLAVTTQHSIFALFLDSAFSFNAVTTGWFLTGMGVVLAINQGVLLRRFWLKRFSEPMLEVSMCIALALGFLLMSIEILWIFMLGLILVTFSQSILRVVLSSQLVALRPTRRGEILGTMTSVMSVSMFIAPVCAGLLFERHPAGPFVAAAIISIIALLIIFYFRRRFAAANLPDDVEPVEVV